MYILTEKNIIINCDNTKSIEYVLDLGKYNVVAFPGGEIIRVNSKEDAEKCIKYIYYKLINNTSISYRDLLEAINNGTQTISNRCCK